ASGLYPYAVGRPASGWRDHAIFALNAADIDKLMVEGGGSKLVLTRDGADKGNETKWKIAESTGAAPKTENELDLAQVNAVVQGVANLHAADFADDKKVEDVKGKGPSLTVTAKGAPHTLWVGEAKGDDVYVATSDVPQVYTVRKYSIEHLAKKPIDYRDKTIAKIKEPDIASVDTPAGGETTTLTQGNDGKWTASKGTADPTKVKPVILGFDNLTASSFSDDTQPAKTGLAKPQGRAV